MSTQVSLLTVELEMQVISVATYIHVLTYLLHLHEKMVSNNVNHLSNPFPFIEKNMQNIKNIVNPRIHPNSGSLYLTSKST